MFLFIHGKSAEIDIIMFTDIHDYSLKHYKEQKNTFKTELPKATHHKLLYWKEFRGVSLYLIIMYYCFFLHISIFLCTALVNKSTYIIQYAKQYMPDIKERDI